MQNNSATASPSVLIDQLIALINDGVQGDRYAQYAELISKLVLSEFVCLVNEQLQVLGAHDPGNEMTSVMSGTDEASLSSLNETGHLILNCKKSNDMGMILLGIRLLAERPTFLFAGFAERHRSSLKEALIRLMLVKDIRSKSMSGAVSPVGVVHSASQLLQTLDCATTVMNAKHFKEAALKLVNGLLPIYNFDRVMLLWRAGQSFDLCAVSHLERFEKTANVVEKIIDAAKDVLVRDTQLILTRADVESAEGIQTGAAHLFSEFPDAKTWTGIPLRDEHSVIHGVLMFFSSDDRLNENIEQNIGLTLDILYPRLADLHAVSGNFVSNAKNRIRERIELFLGPSRPWIKVWTLIVVVLVLVLAFVKIPYRVEASAQLATDYTRILGSQYDGKVDSVFVNIGDAVQEGQVLAELDETDFRHQREEVEAEIQRYGVESDKARAAGAMADAQIALYRRSQALAKLERLDSLIRESRIRAPFDGVLVEGDRKDLLGASVKRGEQMFRVAQVRELFVVAQVSERDVREVVPNAKADLVLISHTTSEIPVSIANFIPMAQVKGDQGNHFLLKAHIDGPSQTWWRPGMSGVLKIDTSDKTIGWILFHSLMDTIRLKFWW